jgi:ankyrin repeat protein
MKSNSVETTKKIMGPRKIKELQLLKAAIDGDLALVETLSVDPEIDINNRWNYYNRPLFTMACGSGNANVVRYLLDFNQRAIEYNNVGLYGWTPFYAACYCEQEEVIEMLLADERIDINKGNSWGQTPLWFASNEGRLEVVKLILMSGRQIDTTKKYGGGTALDAARYGGHHEIVSLIETFQRGPDFLGTSKFLFFFLFNSPNSSFPHRILGR